MADHDVPAPLLQNLIYNPNLARPPSDGPSCPTPRVAIVGGSMGGCCAAIALAAEGCAVTVFERTPGELPSQGAGLVIQPDLLAFLQHHNIVTEVSAVSFLSSGRQYVDRSGAVIGGDDVPQAFSAWDVLHRALRAAVPNENYRSGCTVSSVHADAKGAILTLGDGTGVEVDLVVGADGPGSTVRATFLPEERSAYQGYVAWRGLLPESEAPPAVLEFLRQKFTVFRSQDTAHPGHILAYLIPGAAGETAPGTRRINWVWYENWDESKLSEILTDANGRKRSFSVPRGLLRSEVAAAVRAAAAERLPPALSDMVGATQDIFVQAIHDYLASTLALGGGRVVLLGDAGAILRPHTAAGTTKAAVNAWALARCLREARFDVVEATGRYSEAMLEVGKELVDVGVAIGTKSQFPERVGEENGAVGGF